MTIARNDPAWATFLTCVLSHFAIFPAMRLLIRRNWLYETTISCFAMSCSFMYHTCQAFGVTLFLNELQWHRLDNIGAISTFSMMFTYLSAIEDPRLDFFVKFSGLIVAIVSQEHSPWDITFTAVPVVMYACLPVISYFMFHYRCSTGGLRSGRWSLMADLQHLYELKSVVLGFGFMACAVPFFIAGLNDAEDPFRIFHGMWHLMGGLSAYYFYRIVKNPIGTSMQEMLCEVDPRGPRMA